MASYVFGATVITSVLIVAFWPTIDALATWLTG
jgi:hypothetical protein